MINRNSIKKLIAHPAIMQQKTLDIVIKRHNAKLSPRAGNWYMHGIISDKWIDILNSIPELRTLDLDDVQPSLEDMRALAIERFNLFVKKSGMTKIEIANALGMVGDCGQGVQRWKKTGVGKNSVEKFVEVFGENGGYWRPDLGYLRFEK